MSRTATPADPLAELSFELDGFRWAGEERLELTGRWFGVRGRRFVRPTLTLRADGRRRRLIALLEHKPWAAVEDDAWTAAFAWRGAREDITAARLEVAPDVVLELPAPGEAPAGTRLHPRPRRRPPAATAAPPEAAAEDAPAAAPAPPASESPGQAASDDAPAPDPAAFAAAREEGERLGRERADAEIVAVREDAERRLAEAERRIEALSQHEASAVERAREVVRLEGELAAARAAPERGRRELVEARRRAERAEQTTAGLRQRVTDANSLTARLERRLVEAAELNERLRQRIAELEAAAGDAPPASPDEAAPGGRAPAASGATGASSDLAGAELDGEHIVATPRPRRRAGHLIGQDGRGSSWAARPAAIAVAAVLLIALAVLLLAVL